MKTIICLANEDRIPEYQPGMRHGAISLANEARLNELHFSEPLTAYAVGYPDTSNIDAVTDFVAPLEQVGRRFEFKSYDSKEPFYTEVDDVRAIGGDFKKVEFSGSTNNSKTLNKGLTVSVDLDQVEGKPNWQQSYTALLLQRIKRNDMKRATTALLAAATNTAKTWDASSGKDPDTDVLSDLKLTADTLGMRANRVLYGDGAWVKRVLSLRAQNSAGGVASAGMTEAQLAAFLRVNGVMVSTERYQSSSTAKSQVVPDVVLSFTGLDGQIDGDPSNAKRFWSPCVDGSRYRVYVNQVSSKRVEITVEHYSIIVVVHTLGLRKLTIS